MQCYYAFQIFHLVYLDDDFRRLYFSQTEFDQYYANINV